MFKKILILIAFFCFSYSNSFSRVNEQVVHDALGFMIGGDSGWGAVTNEYEIDGCVTTYVQPFGDLNLIAIYDYFSYTPRDRDLNIFPASLHHWVEPVPHDRYVIAGN